MIDGLKTLWTAHVGFNMKYDTNGRTRERRQIHRSTICNLLGPAGRCLAVVVFKTTFWSHASMNGKQWHHCIGKDVATTSPKSIQWWTPQWRTFLALFRHPCALKSFSQLPCVAALGSGVRGGAGGRSVLQLLELPLIRHAEQTA